MPSPRHQQLEERPEPAEMPLLHKFGHVQSNCPTKSFNAQSTALNLAIERPGDCSLHYQQHTPRNTIEHRRTAVGCCSV
ncbi:hypothetical protein FALCPG4_009262 [Fusarium falciforme]